METRIVSVLGSVAKHILHSLRRAFIAISVTGLSVAVVAGVATEALASVLTGKFPPGGPTHLAAAAMAIAFGYAAGMTVAIVEILKGLVEAIELVVKETEKLAAEALHEAERLGGAAIRDAERAGRVALSDAETVGRDAFGVVGGVAGGVEHAVGSIFHHGQSAAGAPQSPNQPRS
jgi:hypothetical protein